MTQNKIWNGFHWSFRAQCYTNLCRFFFYSNFFSAYSKTLYSISGSIYSRIL